MFTFGRDHELKCVAESFKDSVKAKLLLDVVNIIHDYLDNTATAENVIDLVKLAIIEGKSGVWESTGSWLLKLGEENDVFQNVWRELVTHPCAEVRFKVGAHISDLPKGLNEEIYNLLLHDKSKKVREHVIDNWEFYNNNYT